MNIGGLQKTSLTDYPDKVSAVVFTNGCVFRCRFCYNSSLVLAPFPTTITTADFLDFLKQRAKILDAVVITGGEPTIHPDLPEFIKQIKTLGFLVKLDTCGYLPTKLQPIIEAKLVDYLAMDIKAPLDRYSEITGINTDTQRIKDSISLIINSNIPHEFRTTLIQEFHQPEDILTMAQLIKGAQQYFLQPFQSKPTIIDPSFQKFSPIPTNQLTQLAQQCQEFVSSCQVRA